MNRLAPLLFLLALTGIATAQDAAPLSVAKSQCTTDFADNTTGAITPALLRQCVLDTKAYAQIYVHDGATAQTSIATTPVLMTGVASDGPEFSANADVANDRIILPSYAATWLVNFNCYFSGDANDSFQMHLRADAVEVPNCAAGRKIGSGGDAGSNGFSCLYTAAADDVLTVYVESDDAGGSSITPIHCSLAVRRADL